MRILRAADYRVMPWKNGGGTTTEIAVSPQGAGMDTFDWRVSMASVEQDGPFSSFPGIDRTLAVLEGQGIILNVAGRIPIGLTTISEPLPFPADMPTNAALINGPITDFNVMTRRGRKRHSVERLKMTRPLTFAADAEVILLFCPDGEIRISAPEKIRLGPLDSLLVEGGAAIAIAAAKGATLFVVRVDSGGRGD